MTNTLQASDYVELHVASAFSFLEGASLPEALAQRAGELHLPAMALVDANGVYGAPRFYKAAKAVNVRPLIGAEVTLALPSRPRLTLLIGSREGYRNLCRLITAGALGKEKGQGCVTWEQLAAHRGGLYCLTGGDEGLLNSVRFENGDSLRMASEHLERLQNVFDDRLYVELQRHFRPDEEHRNQGLLKLAVERKLPIIATNGVRYATAQDKDLFDVATCIRLHTTLEAAGTQLSAHRDAYLKNAEEMTRLFSDLPQAIRATTELAGRLAFTLEDLGYRFPEFPLPAGQTSMEFLREITWRSAPDRFPVLTDRVRAQLEKELNVIAKLDLAGYFLIVWDIVQFCKSEKIMAQGRGSAANSAVCYALSITAVDPIKMDLLFERFLSEERGEWPDIDIDLPSGDQREKVIQHLYTKYGAQGSAMTANVITYQPRSAMREVSKVLGYSPTQVDLLSKCVGSLRHGEVEDYPKLLHQQLGVAGLDSRQASTQVLVSLWQRFMGLPRHLGQHSGGMVMAAGRLDEVVPLEPASMPGRVVVQWDKEDCADMGLIKIDLLGLGMLQVLEETVSIVRANENAAIDIAHLPPDDPAVYRMLNAADTVGVFQVESRAQMASLPRNAPQNFYDIVVQVAIIRPGPIQGGMVNPYFDRRNGKAPVEYPHPCLEPILKRTLGVPLFQEQVIRIAVEAAGFTGGEAEELRRTMGWKRSHERMRVLEEKLVKGMLVRGIPASTCDVIRKLIRGFASYGFPESHAASFALIAYASTYFKAHHPAAFYAALLNAWPMGFYHPATLVKDAQRHGIQVRPIDVQTSGWNCRWETPQAFSLGLRFVKGLKPATGVAIEAAQALPYGDVENVRLRSGATAGELEQLGYAGAFGSLGLTRRGALWQVAQAGQPLGELFEGRALDADSPLPAMSDREENEADYRSAGLTAGPHLMTFLREDLRRQGVLSKAELEARPNGARVRTAGAVIVRQRPGSAKGFVFITLEDETGLLQAIVRPDLFQAQRATVFDARVLWVEGVLQKEKENISVRAQRLKIIDASASIQSHDFH